MEAEALDRARREIRVMAELTELATADEPFGEIVYAVLRLVERLVSSPLLCLSIREQERIGHYARPAPGLDPVWVDVAARMLAEAQESRLQALPATVEMYSVAGPPGWFLVFPAQTRSGRTGSLAIGSAEPLAVEPDEEALMSRLAAQVVLVLDHALLLDKIQDGETLDGLTGAASYRRLLDMLDYELARHRYTGGRLALMLLDVEGLEGINRSYGRGYGNHILQQLAKLIRESARHIDLVARCGTHDFAVMLPETGDDEARDLSEIVRERFMAHDFAGGAVGLSVGVVHARPGEALSPENLLRRAEGALREAKRQQREWSDHSPLSPGAGTPSRPAGR